jgi:hypothetical protein
LNYPVDSVRHQYTARRLGCSNRPACICYIHIRRSQEHRHGRSTNGPRITLRTFERDFKLARASRYPANRIGSDVAQLCYSTKGPERALCEALAWDSVRLVSHPVATFFADRRRGIVSVCAVILAIRRSSGKRSIPLIHSGSEGTRGPTKDQSSGDSARGSPHAIIIELR